MEDSLSRGRKGKKTKVKPNEDDITPAPADKLSIYIMESFKRCTDNIEALKYDCKVKELETACLTGHALELRDKVAPVSYMIGTFNSQWPEVTNASKKKKKGKGKAKKPAPKDYTEMSASDVIQCTSQALTEIENIFPKLHELMECKKEIRDMESWISASADSVQSGIAIEPEPGSCSTNGDSLLKIPPNIRIQMEKFFNAYLEQRNEVSGLKEDIQRLQQERKEIDDKGQTIEQDHERLEAEMLSKEEDIGKLTEKVSCRDKKIEDLKHQNDMLLRRQEQGKEALSQLKQNIKDAEASTQERQNLQQNINQLNEEIAKKKEIVQHVIQEKESFRAEMLSRDEEIRMLKKDMSSRSKEIDDLKNQNDNLLNRISKQAEARLTDGNHAITDLSDPNRPTSLAEKFSELYDNEWTEAFEEVTDNKQKTTEMKDNEAIAFLLDILCVTNDYCRTQADAQWREMLDAVCQKSTDDVPQIPAIFIKDLRNVRKMTGNISAESVVKRFVTSELSRLNTNPEKIGGSNLNLYIQKCVELCWLMSTQNPPLFLYRDVKLNDHLDQDYFKFYTCGGTTVDFLVWPALLCKENGDLLRKGVCQGLKRK